MDIDGFLARYAGLSDNTRRGYRNTLELLERTLAHSEPADDEVRGFLQRFKLASTLQRHKAAIRKYYHFQQRLWPFDAREFPAILKNRVPIYLSKEEVDKLIEAAPGGHERMFIKTLFMTGLRISELMSLEKDTIEPDGIRVLGKGNKERLIPYLTPAFAKQVQVYAKGRSGKLFPWPYTDYWRYLKKLCRAAHVKQISPHKLRASIAVFMAKQGVKDPTIQSFLGHTNVATTMIYTRFSQEDNVEELKKVGNVL